MKKLDTACTIVGLDSSRIFKVATRSEPPERLTPLQRCALWDPEGTDRVEDHEIGLWGARLTPGIPLTSDREEGVWIHSLQEPDVVAPGDVIRLDVYSAQLKILYRRGSTSNTLFVTERCNSRCLMCSQPPRNEDDSWRLRELKELITLIDRDERCLGITGGEPTLLGAELSSLINMCKEHLPQTALHILTNGRLLSDPSTAAVLARPRHPNLVWGIPLYSDSYDIHDYVVQARGAFDETIRGIYNMARLNQQIEIRVVLQNPTISRLRQLAYFIFHNMPFVAHVAFMGLEPIGFFKINHRLLWSDPVDYVAQLEDAVFFLANRGMQVSIYNLPLCILPKNSWSFAQQSISDWKNYYPESCNGCAAIDRCAGFFASAMNGWRSRGIRPLSTADLSYHTDGVGALT